MHPTNGVANVAGAGIPRDCPYPDEKDVGGIHCTPAIPAATSIKLAQKKDD